MSMYVHFFIRRGDEFIPIGEYSRNSMVYQIVDTQAVWEKVKPLTKSRIQDYVETATRYYAMDVKMMADTKEKMAHIKDLSCTWEQALDCLEGYEDALQEYEEEMQECKFTEHFFEFLIDIIETVQYADEKIYDPDNYIYVGVEIGHPTVKDIV